VIIFYFFMYDYAIKQPIFGGFFKLNSSKHPTVTTQDVRLLMVSGRSYMDLNISTDRTAPGSVQTGF